MLDQTLEFLFSERGEFLRDRIVSELVNSLDLFGQNALDSITATVRRRMGWRSDPLSPQATSVSATTSDSSDLDHLRRIVDILKETQGFDAP